MPDTISVSLGFIGIAVAALALVITTFFAIYSLGIIESNRKLKKRTKKLEKTLAELMKAKRSTYYLSDTLASATNALYQFCCVNAASWISPTSNSAILLKEQNEAEFAANKALTELGLFSENSQRGLSVLRSLVHEYGERDTLLLMRNIRDVWVGDPEPHLVDAIDQLEQRLMKPKDDPDLNGEV